MKLSPKEQDVLTLIACGFTDKEIGIKLKISKGTVHTHVENIFDKLRAKTRGHAVSLYINLNPKWKREERYLKTV
ncbi:response regulator transcription factor [bacterium]|nr:response regulator transcription factor [bacterium]